MRKLLRKSSGMIVVAVATALAVSTFGSGALATHQPADKPFAAASKVIRSGPTEGVELLRATVKNAKPTDLILQVSLECALVTDTILLGSTTPGAQDSTRATATVRAWITIDDVVVPIISEGSGEPGDDTDKVTFCNRVFERTVQDTEDPEDGYDGSRDYIATKSANSFNWVRLNMGSGLHTISLWAEVEADATGASAADAYIGNRSLVGIPGKFANDATITEGTA
ncbi:MAG TPA: hypothetical protein VGB83_03000 [Actinomycetota bacterium]